jgi:hypothetical protein
MVQTLASDPLKNFKQVHKHIDMRKTPGASRGNGK